MGWLDKLKAKITGKPAPEVAVEAAPEPAVEPEVKVTKKPDVIASEARQSIVKDRPPKETTDATKGQPAHDDDIEPTEEVEHEEQPTEEDGLPRRASAPRNDVNAEPEEPAAAIESETPPESAESPEAEKSTLSQKLSNLFASRKAFDEDFWDDLTDTLILADFGAQAAMDIIDDLKDAQKRQHLVKPEQVKTVLTDLIARKFYGQVDYLAEKPLVLIFVGVNGAGKTTTIGKLAHRAKAEGRKVLLGAADTYRAAAIEQIEIWASRAQVDIETATRGEDAAAVAYRSLERGKSDNYDLIMIDTAGRLHTSDDLMRELAKVIKVARNKADEIGMANVHCVLVVDGNSGQNALAQAEQFNKSLDLDAVVITKLDGRPKGGSAVQVSALNELPIWLIGIGEQLDDLLDFDAQSYAEALLD